LALPEKVFTFSSAVQGATKVAPIGVRADEPGKDGVSFAHQRATVVKFGFGHSAPPLVIVTTDAPSGAVVISNATRLGTSAMPSDNRLRLEDFHRVQHLGSQVLEPRKHQAIDIADGNPLGRPTPQHIELMPKGKNFGLQHWRTQNHFEH
jgi:hypothetical protein